MIQINNSCAYMLIQTYMDYFADIYSFVLLSSDWHFITAPNFCGLGWLKTRMKPVVIFCTELPWPLVELKEFLTTVDIYCG